MLGGSKLVIGELRSLKHSELRDRNLKEFKTLEREIDERTIDRKDPPLLPIERL